MASHLSSYAIKCAYAELSENPLFSGSTTLLQFVYTTPKRAFQMVTVARVRDTL